jgi:hypothetical protein
VLSFVPVTWCPGRCRPWGGSPANTGRITERAELVSHHDYGLGNVVFHDGMPAALSDFDLAKPTSRRRSGTNHGT